MPTADPSNVLFKIAHPDLYERNPFNVLNLPVDATAKDIRRRKEDLEAAFDAGTEAEEFRNMLPGDDNRKMPTRAEVEELFSVLEDPEKSIAYSLFWFWPDSSETPGGGRRRSNPNGAFGHSSVIAKWEETARGSSATSSSPSVAKHNLAVFHHMMGLAYELELRKYDIRTANTPANVPQHWKAAIYWWNDISGQADFWHAVSENVSALNDPRLDFHFARALKEQFAFAFDQINVELAIDFAKTGREADSKRQVEYMKLSQPDADDVEGTFDDAFAGLLRQTEIIVKTADIESNKMPKSGLNKANEILAQTEEILRIARTIFGKGAPIRNSIISTVIAGVRNCLMDFGNETNDWDTCLIKTRQLFDIAESCEQIEIIEKDRKSILDIIESNREPCVICQKPIQENEETTQICVSLYGKVSINNDNKSVAYKSKCLSFSACSQCSVVHRLKKVNTFLDYPDIVAHPLVQKELDEGWNLGEKISEQALESVFWNRERARVLPPDKESIRKFLKKSGMLEHDIENIIRHVGFLRNDENNANLSTTN